MILSRYTNPPYRSPMTSTSASPPPPHHQISAPPPSNSSQSPKRKRTDSTALLPIDTDLSDVPGEGSGANSPRSRVAERLRGLDLQHTPQLKRQKLKRRFAGEYENENEMEIEETPQQPQVVIESAFPPDESSPVPNGFLPQDRPAAPASSKRLTSPPPPPSLNSSFNSTTSISSSDSPDPSSLTWQETEITGQEIDTSTPDDDGEGINGVGFKPTPAMAQARSLKRRQQVNEWKAREAREARQKRLDRRRKGSGSGSRGEEGMGTGNGEAKRSVRFAGFS